MTFETIKKVILTMDEEQTLIKAIRLLEEMDDETHKFYDCIDILINALSDNTNF